MDKICYQSYSWVVGTTSFRNAKLNLKIEQQLSILDNFHKTISKKDKWTWNKDLQEKYYNFMKDAKFINGDAKRKDKDARQKTSSLESIGLITKDREITEVGYELLSIIENQNFNKDNIFNIDNDNYIVYTDNTLTDQGNLDVIINKYEINDGNIVLLEIPEDKRKYVDDMWSLLCQDV